MSDTTSRPRIRVPAGSEPLSPKSFMTDSFQNLGAQLGYGAQNLSSGNTYGFNPITRNHTQLEWMYRGSWLVKQIVDAPADDMTRAGTDVESEMSPDDMKALDQYWRELMMWQRLNSTLKWSRLYGGCIALMMIEGQKTDTPLNTETVAKGQFKGLIVLDRWMVWPHLSETVEEIGPDFGQPKYYQIVADVKGLPKLKIHHTRIIRFDGVELPYWQTIAENGWGLSVIEPLLDRMVAFDSVTQGAAQLAFKAHLRVVRVDGLRELIASGGQVYQAFLQQMAMIRLMQTNEGMTVLDKEDEFQANTYTFAGLPDLLIQFGQQLSGASQIPLTRLFGQSPAGMNSTGESDMRNYYDSINAQQMARMHRPLVVLYDVTHRSKFGRPLPEGFSFTFTPLWQLQAGEKATIAGQVTTFIDTAKMGGLIGAEIALKELKQSARTTGYFSNITDEDINKAKEDDALLPDPMLQPPDPNAQPPHTPSTPPAGDDPDAEADDSALPTTGRIPRRRHPVVSRMFPNTQGWTLNDLPHYAQRMMATKEDVKAKYGHLANGTTIQDVRTLYHMQDKYPMRDIHGLTVVIETEKGARRIGYGWSATVKADYGYISGTGSAEGGTEQMDAFVGDSPESKKVWIIQQVNPVTGAFDESKIMLCFDTKEQAVTAYEGSFSDGQGSRRVGRVSSTNVETVKSWLDTHWHYNTTSRPDHSGRNSEP